MLDVDVEKPGNAREAKSAEDLSINANDPLGPFIIPVAKLGELIESWEKNPSLIYIQEDEQHSGLLPLGSQNTLIERIDSLPTADL